MATSCDLSFQQKSLFQQGYQRFTPQELKQLEWGLRFTPAVCSAITALALYFQLPYVLFAVAGLGMWAFLLPAAHPMDLLYNHAIRHLFGAVKLPENPFQRRLACLSAGIMNVAAAVLFLLNLPLVAMVVGGMLLVLQAIVIFTHFCTLSWMYEGVMRLLGRWQVPVDEHKARQMLQQGALLVDVRSPNEFARESIEGAINLPLEELHQHLDKFANGICLLFCNSGTRSHIAAEKLKNMGVDRIYNLGAFARARQMTLATA
jgi:rhodanese-related sulfurtransferase